MAQRKPQISETQRRINEAGNAMQRLQTTFLQGSNRHGEYGRNCREAFERHARLWSELTGKPVPNIYDN